MVGILKCFKTALPCTGEMELARFKTFPDCSVAEPKNGACSICPERELTACGPPRLWVWGLKTPPAAVFLRCRQQPVPTVFSLPSFLPTISQGPRITASGQCCTPALGGPGTLGVCGGSFWKTIRASAARGQPSPAAARPVTGHLPPGNTGL